MPLVLKIMPDIPRDFLAEFMPDESYKTFRAWQSGKRTPRNPGGLIAAIVAWAGQYVPNAAQMTAQELLTACLAYKQHLCRKVRRKTRQMPDSVLHHRMNLNAGTITRLRNGHELRLETLRRLYESLLDQRDCIACRISFSRLRPTLPSRRSSWRQYPALPEDFLTLLQQHPEYRAPCGQYCGSAAP